MRSFKFYFVILLVLSLAFTITRSYGQVAIEQQTEVKSLDESLEFVVAKAIEIAETTGEFVIEQAPLLLQEFYAWHIALSLLDMAVGVIILLAGFFIPRMWNEEKEEYSSQKKFLGAYYDDEGPIQFAIFTTILSVIFGFVFIVCGAYNLVFITVAPKLYLIEYFVGGC